MANSVTIGNTIGYPQVEPNHLSAPRNGGVYGQLPADSTIAELSQGQFVHYNYAAGKVTLTGDGPLMMVFNEEKLYDERHQMHRDYIMKKTDFYDGVMTPRVFRLVVGDIYTTNNLVDGTYQEGDKVTPNANGILKLDNAATTGLILQVVKAYTMPDGHPGVKLQVISV